MKTRLLKITLSFALTFLISAISFGQSIPADLVEDTDSTAIDSVTTGYDIPYYVTPDPTLNSSYDGTYDIGASDQGFSSTWNWQITGTATGNISQGPDTSTTAGDHPYAEVEWDVPGTSGDQAFIEAQEEGPTGTCNGVWKGLEVQVFDKPEFDFTDADNGTNADTLVEICATQGAQNVIVNNITDNNVSGGNFKFRLDIKVDSVAAENASSTGASLGNIRGGTGSAQEDTIVAISETSGSNVTLLPNYYMTAVEDNDGNAQITRYRFDFGNTLYSASNSNGITDHIQRKSQYLTNPDKYDDPDETGNSNNDDWDYIADNDNDGQGSMVTFIVYPAPTTGNIHYVPNNFDQ